MNMTLIEQIKEAFENVEYPGDMNLVENIQDFESHKMFQVLKGKDWRDITDDIAGDWRMSLPLLTNMGFHYFLPAFMLASLGEDKYEVGTFLVYRLEPPTDKSELAEFHTRMGEFNKSQASAIYKYLKSIADYVEELDPNYLKEALDFWKQAST